MESLQDINQQAIFAKLDAITRRKVKNITLYLANDLLHAVSLQIHSDKKLISTYKDNTVICWYNGRRYRFLTMEAIKRYIHEGHIYSYANVCKYFNEEPRDRKVALWLKQVNKCLASNDMCFITSRIMKFIYGKRKKTQLELTCVKEDLISINISDQNKEVKDRYEWLMNAYLKHQTTYSIEDIDRINYAAPTAIDLMI